MDAPRHAGSRLRRRGLSVALLTVAAVAALAALWPAARAQVRAGAAATACGPAAIGLERTHEIDARGGPRLGGQQYPGREFLKPGEVVLTFDDGPHKMLTPPILDVLAKHCTKATFFMVGQRSLHFPEIVRDVARRGHTIGTHTWSHQNQAELASDQAKNEIELGISGVQHALGIPAAPFFRFPYLSDPQASQAHLRSRNTANISIDIDSYDFKTRSPTVVVRNVMQQLQSKGRGIILFHDIQPSTAGGLDQLLTEMKVKGFKVVHIVPAQAQTTVAEFDRRVKQLGGTRLASLPVPLAQRGVVSPAWEVRVFQRPGQVPLLLDPVSANRPNLAQPRAALPGAPSGAGAPATMPIPQSQPRTPRLDRPSPFSGN